MLDSSNFVRLSTVKVLCYMVGKLLDIIIQTHSLCQVFDCGLYFYELLSYNKNYFMFTEKKEDNYRHAAFLQLGLEF